MRVSKIMSRRDLDFLLFEWLDVASLIERPRFSHHSAETIAGVLDLAEDLAVRYFAPHNALGDANEPRFDGERVHSIPEVGIALKAFTESGLLATTQDEAVGGEQLPNLVHRAAFVWFQAANISTSSYLLLTMANANLLLRFGSQDQVDRYAIPQLEGRFFGTMCLSEPNVGSSLGDIRTRAVSAGDGTYRMHGTKMWISGGDHELAENIVHLVLARVEGAPAGPKGLSLFLVPRFLVQPDGSIGGRNDVVLAGVNHKLGYRGIVNTVLSFGDGTHRPGGQPGAVAYLVGEENRGLEYMFHMMNDARIGIGAGAVGLGYTGYLHALDYARSRPQGRPIGEKDPQRPPVPIVRHPDVRRMLLASKCYVEGGLALVLYSAALMDEKETAPTAEARDRAGLLLDVLTPIVKSWPSQWCLAANDHAIQVHGGYGYSREYLVEQLYRDNRLNPIHEGTHAIQALDLLGRKVVMRGGAALSALLEVIRGTVNRAWPTLPKYAERLAAATDRLEATTKLLWADGDARRALVNSALYLEAAGHVVVAWIWLEQALVTGDRSENFYAAKRAAADYFFTYELPRIGSQLDILDSLDMSLADLDDTIL